MKFNINNLHFLKYFAFHPWILHSRISPKIFKERLMIIQLIIIRYPLSIDDSYSQILIHFYHRCNSRSSLNSSNSKFHIFKSGNYITICMRQKASRINNSWKIKKLEIESIFCRYRFEVAGIHFNFSSSTLYRWVIQRSAVCVCLHVTEIWL